MAMLPVFKKIKETLFKAEAHDETQFYKSQWQTSPYLTKSFVVYRWIIACIFLVVLIAAVFDMGTTTIDCLKFFIYLTHWGFVLCTVQAILGATVVTQKYCEVKRLQNDAEKAACLRETPTSVKIYWVIYSMSVVIAFGITIIFWTRVYKPDYHEWGIMIFLLHGLNTLLMFLDVMIVAHPLKFLHFIWTFVFVVVYLFFSYLYHLAGGTNVKKHSFIYHSLNWENPDNALRFCISSLLYGFVIHVCMWIFSVIIRKISGAARSVNSPTNIVTYSSGLQTAQDHCINIVPIVQN